MLKFGRKKKPAEGFVEDDDDGGYGGGAWQICQESLPRHNTRFKPTFLELNGMK